MLLFFIVKNRFLIIFLFLWRLIILACINFWLTQIITFFNIKRFLVILISCSIQFRYIDSFWIKPCDRYLISYYQMSNFNTFLCLFKSFFVSMKLWKYCTELQSQSYLYFHFVQPHCKTLFVIWSVICSQMIECRL